MTEPSERAERELDSIWETEARLHSAAVAGGYPEKAALRDYVRGAYDRKLRLMDTIATTSDDPAKRGAAAMAAEVLRRQGNF
ncbi:MAG TPA: hypothetical protein VH561_14050 [Micromonosporaceae bacterium]|jgi:hypothetical protein